MTTLRSFQSEIQDIQNRETAKQRTQGLPKENVKEANQQQQPQVAKDGAKSTGKDKESQQRSTSLNMAEEAEEKEKTENEIDLTLTLEEIQLLLLSENESDHDRVRDELAALLTRHRGEYIFRIGQHPDHAQLYDLPQTGAGVSSEKTERRGQHRTLEEIARLKHNLQRTVEELGGQVSILFESLQNEPHLSLLIRLPPPSVSLTPEVRCAVVGNVDSGKSTTLGVLTRGALDDGRGRARVTLFRHKHEVETGRTSSVGMEILGFGVDGVPVLPSGTSSADPEVARHEKLSWEQISEKSAKVVSFTDLAGHEKYLKTTLYGLTSGSPSCVILMVGANAGLIGMSKEHLAIALALSVPVIVCVTKIDMTPPNIRAETMKQIVKILKSPGCRKTPVFVKSLEIAVEVSQSFAREKQCPIFQISNVTGEGLDCVRTFLNLLPASEAEEKFSSDLPLEYSVTEVWSVPYVGTVCNGIVLSGTISAGAPILLGPDSNGNFISTVVKTMQRKRAPVNVAEAGQCVSLALKRVRRSAVRKGMVIVSKSDTPPRAIRRFEGQVLILYHNTTMQKNYQAMLHCGAIRQTVRILSMDHPTGVLRTGDRATVEFEFISHPEFIKEGMKLLFREGKTKGLGVVTRLLPD